MASKKYTTKRGWGDLQDAIVAWNATRIEQAKTKITEDAQKLRADIVDGLYAGSDKPPTASRLEAMTNVTSEQKASILSQKTESNVNTSSGKDLYAKSIVVEDESTGTKFVKTVKIDDDKKKDETSGLPLAKLAKATEFGTTTSAPNPVWRRSLKRLEQTGVYRKKT